MMVDEWVFGYGRICIDAAVSGNDVQFAIYIFAKAGDGQAAFVHNGGLPLAVWLLKDAPNVPLQKSPTK